MSEQTTSYSGSPAYRTIEDLEVYKASREFRIAMYRVAKRLPDFEKFGLASQIRRAAVSLTNNLAEGHGRFHFLEQIRFTLISRGSLEELIDDLNVCSDESYLPAAEVAGVKSAAWQILKLVNGYLRYVRNRKQGTSLELRESPTADAGTPDIESMDWLDELIGEHPDFFAGSIRQPITSH
jgi:four helix bundle protein